LIVKSGRGKGISGTLAYITGEGNLEDGTHITLAPGQQSRAEILGGQNLGLEPEDFRQMGLDDKDYAEFARRQMEYTARPEIQGEKNFYAAKDALHFSLNWAKGEQPTREQQFAAAQDYLKAIGLENAQAVIVAHHDRKEDRKGQPRAIHVHGIAQMVDRETGMAYDDRNRGFRERHWGVEYEERMLKEQNWPIPKANQWRHDLRAVTRGQPDYEEMLAILGKTESAITKFRVENALAFGGHVDPQHMGAHREQFVQHNNMQRLANYPNGADAAYATQETIAQERRVMGMAKKLHAQTGFEVPDHILDEICKRHNADDEQKASARHLTRDNGFAVQTGNAGTGKSHVTNKIVRDCYEAMGRDVAGGGFTNNIALQMKQDGMLRANTLDYWKTRLGFEKPDAPEPILKRGSVFVFDEGGQVKNEHFESLYNHLHARGVKAILSGDPKQMASIEKGAMMDVHIRQFGTSVLSKVYRHPEKQEIWDDMAEGTKARSQSKAEEKWKQAIESFRDRGEIHWFDSTEEAIAGIAKQHAQDHKDHPDRSQLMLGTTNDEVRQLNEAAIALQKENGTRGSEILIETSRGLRAYAIGDRITLKDNHPDVKEKRKGFANGALGNLIGLQPEADGRHRMTVDLDRPKGAQRRVFSFFPGLDKEAGEIDTDHAWAGTNYKAQCKTIDYVYPLHNPITNRNGAYVGMTRDKVKVFLGVARETTGGYRGLVEQMCHGKNKRAAHSYFMKDEQSTQPQRLFQKQEEEVVATRERGRDIYRNRLPAARGLIGEHNFKQINNGKPWKCHDCNEFIVDKKEDYMVKDEVWAKAGMKKKDGFLCIGDLEKRIGLQLNKDDFSHGPNFQINSPDNSWRSEKLQDRLTREPEFPTEPRLNGFPQKQEPKQMPEHQPRVKIFGWEFGESGRKARGTEGLYKAAEREDDDLVVQRHNGVTVYPKFDGKTVIPKWDQQDPKRKETLHPPKPVNHEYADGKWKMKPDEVGQSAYGKKLKEGEAKGWPRGVSNWADLPAPQKERKEESRGWSVNDIPGSRIIRGTARKIESITDNLEEKMREKFNFHVRDPLRYKIDKVLDPVRDIFQQSEQQKERDAKREEKKAATQGPETGNGRTRDTTADTPKPQSMTVRDDVDRAFRPALPAQSKRDKTLTAAPGQSDGKGQESRPAPAKHNPPRDQGHSGGSGLGM
jgi:hypothetical protein